MPQIISYRTFRHYSSLSLLLIPPILLPRIILLLCKSMTHFQLPFSSKRILFSGNMRNGGKNNFSKKNLGQIRLSSIKLFSVASKSNSFLLDISLFSTHFRKERKIIIVKKKPTKENVSRVCNKNVTKKIGS